MKTRTPKAYSRSHLPGHVLMQNLVVHFKEEDGATATLLADLADVDERQLHLPAGYSSLFAYCVGELKRKPDAVAKRIQAARTAREFPAIFEMVAEGRLCLSGVCLLAPHLTEENADELLAAAAEKSKAGIVRLLAQRSAKPALPASLRPAVAGISGNEHAPGHVVVTNGEQATGLGGACDLELTPDVAAPPAQFALQVTLGQEEHDNLRYAQALLGHAVPSGNVRKVLGRALEALIRELERSKFGVGSRCRSRKSEGKGRYIPAGVRRTVWERDGGQCTFVSAAGHRCESTTRLEYDHIQPVARGGCSTAENLRLRCRPHNQYGADCDFGRGFMAEKRAAARTRAAQEKQRQAAEAKAAKEAEERKQRERREADKDLVDGLRNLQFTAAEVRYALEACDATRGAPTPERFRVALSLLDRTRRHVRGPVASLPT